MAKSLNKLLSSLEGLSSHCISEDLLERILPVAMELTGAEEGHILKRENDLWKIGNFFLSMDPGIVDLFKGKRVFPCDDPLMNFLPVPLHNRNNLFIPLYKDKELFSALILKRVNQTQYDLLHLLSLIASLYLKNIALSYRLKEMENYNEKLKLQRETAERFLQLGTIAAGLAHEIKNPLVSIKTLAELLPFKFKDKEFREQFATIVLGEIEHIEHIVADFLDFAKSSEPKFALVEIGEFMDETLDKLTSQFKQRNIEIHRDINNTPLLIKGDLSQLKQVFLNVLLNSMEAMPEGGNISIYARRELSSPGKVIIKISDTGRGIKEEDKKHIFEPFFTTKGNGTGLGLPICKRIIESHGGHIEVESTYMEGTTITITLPFWDKTPTKIGT